MRSLFNPSRSQRLPHVFVPLGNDAFLQSLAIPKDHIHCLDWWESLHLTITGPDSESSALTLELTCTPSQHNSGRGAFDHFQALWGSWVVSQPNGPAVFFAGDTGYRTVNAGQNEDEVPVCPAFKEIGERFGAVDLALLPIGCLSCFPSSRQRAHLQSEDTSHGLSCPEFMQHLKTAFVSSKM